MVIPTEAKRQKATQTLTLSKTIFEDRDLTACWTRSPQAALYGLFLAAFFRTIF
jgi:hypothetical protein